MHLNSALIKSAELIVLAQWLRFLLNPSTNKTIFEWVLKQDPYNLYKPNVLRYALFYTMTFQFCTVNMFNCNCYSTLLATCFLFTTVICLYCR